MWVSACLIERQGRAPVKEKSKFIDGKSCQLHFKILQFIIIFAPEITITKQVNTPLITAKRLNVKAKMENRYSPI